MARTWSLYQTLTLSGTHSLQDDSNVVTDGAGNAYFWTGDTPDAAVWKWDGATVSDISGATFAAAADHTIFGIKLCWFNGGLYFAFNDRDDIAVSFSGEVYKYSGSGQTWVSDYTLVDDSANPVRFIQSSGATNRETWPFDCDANRLIAVGKQDSGTEARLAARNTSGTWTLQTMPTSVYKDPYQSLVGNSKGSDYGEILAVDQPSAGQFRVIKYGTPDWANLSASDIGARYLIGYADSKSFFAVDNGADFDIYYSTDWGVNITSAGLALSTKNLRLANNFVNLGVGAVMLAVKDQTQVYVWNETTDQFDADGTIGTIDNDINGGFFMISNALFALCDSTSSGEVAIFTAPAAYDIYHSQGGIPGSILVTS